MVYQKNPKDSSRRWITIRSVTMAPPEKLTAYCWKRRALKSFRLDRVAAVFDADGVVMEPDSFFGAFGVAITFMAAPPPDAACRWTCRSRCWSGSTPRRAAATLILSPRPRRRW